MMQRRLHVISGPDQGRSFTLGDHQTLVVGRGAASDTQINDPAISRKHCQVEVVGNRIWLVDLASASGTYWRGDRIARQELNEGDVFQIGDTHVRLGALAPADASTIVKKKTFSEPPADLKTLLGKSLGRYRLDKIIARGHSGMVFKAFDSEKQRDAAVKVLAPDNANDEQQKDRFVRAMKTMLPIRHENIVRLYGAGKNGPYCWAAMEFIDGEDLMQLIDRLGIAGMLDWREAWRVVVHIGRALQYGAEQKIVHRNLRPTNILRRHVDKVCLLGDFMLAKASEGLQSRQITQPGQMVGDIAYMAPERTRGEGVDTRSDIYGLGATAYALIAGRAPFAGESLSELLECVRSQSPRKPSTFQLSVDSEFEDIVLRMIAKDPHERPATPAKLLNELDRVGHRHNLEADWNAWN